VCEKARKMPDCFLHRRHFSLESVREEETTEISLI
jgi:hypothetical protein